MTIFVYSSSNLTNATALNIIKRALRLFGVIGSGQEPTAQEAEDGLYALNSMIESWSIERLLVFQIHEESFTWTGGSQSMTIGDGGNFDTTRPTRIESGFTRMSGIDYPYRVIDKSRYDSIVSKDTESTYPDMIYYAPSVPLGVLWAYPVPSASMSIHINSWKQLQGFDSLTEIVLLPAGYQRALAYNLVLELQGEYADLQIPESVLSVATQSKAILKRFNMPTIISDLGFGRGRYNIYSDS